MFNKSLVIIAILLMANNIYGQRRLVDKVIAVVGEEPLYLSELNANLAYAEAKGEFITEQSQCLFFETLLTEKLLVNQAEIDSVEVTEAEVYQQVNGRIAQILTAMNNDTTRFQTYYGKTVESVKEEMSGQMEGQLIRQRMQRNILGRVNVTPGEVKEFFENNKDSLPYYNAEVEVAEVVMLPEPNTMQKQLSYNMLSELSQKIVNGETTFEAAAKEFSHDPGSARQGGDLGLVARGTFVPEFEGTAFNLDINEYSDIIETEFGYHFLQLLDRRGNLLRVRHILRIPPIQPQDEDKVKRKLLEVKELINSDSISFREAVKKYTPEVIPSKSTAGFVINQKTGNTRIEVGDLDFDVFFIIDTMKVGAISDPIEFMDRTGAKGYKIIKLVSRNEAHKASIEKDYYKIKGLTLESKKNEHLATWVANTVGSTFLNIDEDFQSCENIQHWINSSRTNISYGQ